MASGFECLSLRFLRLRAEVQPKEERPKEARPRTEAQPKELRPRAEVLEARPHNKKAFYDKKNCEFIKKLLYLVNIYVINIADYELKFENEQ